MLASAFLLSSIITCAQAGELTQQQRALFVDTPETTSIQSTLPRSSKLMDDATLIDPASIPDDAIEVGVIGPDGSSTPAPAPRSTPAPRTNRSAAVNTSTATAAVDTIPDVDTSYGSDKMEFPVGAADTSAVAPEPEPKMETITVDFPNEDVRTIITNVAELYGINVVVPEELVGRTTIKLKDVTWQQVFEVILDPLGYSYKIDDNIIKVLSKDKLEAELETIVRFINYAVAEQLEPSLAPLIDASKGGLVKVDARTNALVITERPQQLNKIDEIIQNLDKPNPQVYIEAKFIEMKNNIFDGIGMNWSQLNNYNFVSPGSGQIFEFGEGASGIFGGDVGIIDSDGLQVAMDFFKQTDNTKTISNPTIVTLDGEDALISVGQEYPLPNYTYNDERGTFEISGFEFREIGIVLKVRPQINNDGFIRLSIKPEVSGLNERIDFGDNATLPLIDSTKTESEVVLKSGFTLVIGGLIKSEKIKGDQGIPVLSDIPVLGKLFKYNEDSTDETNLVIFVTAKILNPDGTTYKDMIDPRVLDKMELLDSDVPGYKVPRTELQRIERLKQLRAEARALEEDTAYQAQVEALTPKPPKPEAEDMPKRFVSRAR